MNSSGWLRSAQWLSCTVAVLLPASVSADTNGRANPMGGRSGAMGGVSYARGNDSAAAFLNPAGLSRIPTNTVSLSLGVYRTTEVDVERYFSDPSDELAQITDTSGNDISTRSLVTLPSALGFYFHPFSDHPDRVLAFSVLVPFDTDAIFDGVWTLDDPAVEVDASFSDRLQRETYYIGPSYADAISLGEGLTLRLGASVFVALTRDAATSARETRSGTATNFGSVVTTVARTATGFELVGNVGAQLDLPWFSVGATVHAPSTHLYGRSNFTSRGTLSGNGVFGGNDGINQFVYDTDFIVKQPLRAGIGVATTLGSVELGLDVEWIAAVDRYAIFDGEVEITETREGTGSTTRVESLEIRIEDESAINVALGAEWQATPVLALRAGAYTDFARNNVITPPNPQELLSREVDRFGGVLGLAVALGEAAETALAVSYGIGTGDVVTPNLTDPSGFGAKISPFSARELSIFVSGTVDLGQVL